MRRGQSTVEVPLALVLIALLVAGAWGVGASVWLELRADVAASRSSGDAARVDAG